MLKGLFNGASFLIPSCLLHLYQHLPRPKSTTSQKLVCMYSRKYWIKKIQTYQNMFGLKVLQVNQSHMTYVFESLYTKESSDCFLRGTSSGPGWGKEPLSWAPGAGRRGLGAWRARLRRRCWLGGVWHFTHSQDNFYNWKIKIKLLSEMGRD